MKLSNLEINNISIKARIMTRPEVIAALKKIRSAGRALRLKLTASTIAMQEELIRIQIEIATAAKLWATMGRKTRKLAKAMGYAAVGFGSRFWRSV